MSNAATLANSQSLSSVMQKGNAAQIGRMKAMLKQMRDNTNHPFCPPISKQSDADKSGAILRGGI